MILRGWRLCGRALLRDPAMAYAVAQAWLTGRRVRARQLALALGEARHRLALPKAWRAALSGPKEASGETVAVVAPAEIGEGRGFGQAGIVLLVAEGETLVPGALAAVGAAFAADPALQALYGDAVVTGRGGLRAVLRPSFDPDLLLGWDYLGAVVAVRRGALDRRGRAGELEEAAMADLVLRIGETFGDGAVRHLPRVLSTGPGRTPSLEARVAVARRALARAGVPAGVSASEDGTVHVEHPLPEPAPLVSLIVPTRDRLDLLRTCVESLRSVTDWPALEILIVDNDSREPATLAYLDALRDEGIARVVPWPGPFDFAGMNNAAAQAARGALLAFVNNDVEAFRPDWLRAMAGEALRPEVGAVGAKLLDAHGRIQHGGIALGTGGGMATHAHRFFPGDAPGDLMRLRVTHRVSAVTAACLVVEARKFRAVGGFDAAAFAVDFNDVDLCLCLEAAGYQTLMVPRAVLHHREAASRRWTPQARARHEGEVARLRARWPERLRADPFYHPGFDPDLGTFVRLRPEPPGDPSPR